MSDKRFPDFRIRIPPDLKEKIRASAEENNRSMGADIILRLEQSFTQPSSTMVFRETVEDAAKIQDGVFEIDKIKVQELEQKLDTILQEIQTLKKPTA